MPTTATAPLWAPDRIPSDPRALLGMAARLRALATDLEAAAAGRLPDAADLEGAPILDRWSLYQRATPCLVGVRFGHPVLGGDGGVTVTNDLHLLAPDLGIARTLSRWYRLGRSAGDTSAVM